ncbi:hypothetical protein, partial [Streptomyces sp. SID3343]|uniref:hypothetical protein n=1 Tax=Streptomyces sp. SID3343 TaxID=2690260 RepID=UPI00136A6F8E
DIDDVARLLAERALPARWAGHVHRLSGGNPVLAKAVLADLPADTARPEALPAPTLAIHLAASRLAELPDEVRHTLRLAALAAHPTPAL